MELETPEGQAGAARQPSKDESKKKEPKSEALQFARLPSIIVALVVAAVAGLSIWYLVRGEPLLVQGEVDATRFDIAARVDGRVGEIPVTRAQDVDAGAVLVKIDNPETLAKHEQALAAKVVADAQLANIHAGTRVEVIAARKAAQERAEASVILAEKTYDRTRQLASSGNAPQARLDQATDALHESERAADQAKSAHEQAVNGFTREEREIAEANVGKAVADIKAVQSIIDQMVVYAPVASQVYQRNVEPGEYVSPGVPLVTLIDLNDMWVHFDLREDLVKTLKIGDRFGVRIPALSDRLITVEVKLIATKGEYASWRATHCRLLLSTFRSCRRLSPRSVFLEIWSFGWVYPSLRAKISAPRYIASSVNAHRPRQGHNVRHRPAANQSCMKTHGSGREKH